MSARTLFNSAAVLLLCGAAWAGQPTGSAPVMQSIDGVRPTAAAFKLSPRGEPLVIRSAGDAARCFDPDAVKKLSTRVDFEEQFVLLFAWSGSGQDKLKSEAADGETPKVWFRIARGRTRDLRRHAEVFALRRGVAFEFGK